MTKKSLRNKIIIIAAAAILAGVAAFFYLDAKRTPDSGTESSDTTMDTDTGEKNIDEPTTSDTNSGGQTSEKPSSNPAEPPPPPPPTAGFQLTLVRAEQSGQTVEVRAFVSGVTFGTCQVSFSGPGTAFTKSKAVIFDGRNYTCGALNASAAEFNVSGNWNYSLKATSAAKTSNTVTGQVKVTK